MNDHPFFSGRAKRRDQRLASFSGLGAALRHVASGWDLQERLNGESFGKPSTLPETIKKAVATVRDTLDEIGEFPIPPVIEYQSARAVKAAAGGTEQTPLIADGVIMLQARFLTKTGVRDSFDVPVLIRDGQVMPPSVIMHDGHMKVLAPSSVREMVARGTFTQQAPSRGEFSGPLTHDEVQQWNQIERDFKTHTRLNPGMFSVNGSHDLLRAAVRGDAAFDRACMEHTAQTAEYDYSLRGTDQDQIGTLYELCKAMAGANRNAGASIVRKDGTMVAFYDDAQQTVAPTSQANDYERSTCEDVRPFLRGAQLGDQPSRAHMGFEASPASRIGDRIVTMVTWDPDRVEAMGDQNLQYAIRSFVLELGTKKEWRDWGTIADVQVDEFDRDAGSARVTFKSSEISAPQLSGADFEDMAKSAGFSRAAAFCEKCQVNHRPGTVCPHSKQTSPKAPKAPKAPKPKKTNLGEKGQEIAAKQPKPDAGAHEHMTWSLDHIADAIDEAQHAYRVDGLLRRGPGAVTRAADQLVTKLMDSYQHAVTSEHDKVRAMPEGQEKDRAKKIINMIGSQFSYGGRGLDRQRSPEKTKAVMDRVKPLWAELGKLTGGQMQMFARRTAASSLEPGRFYRWRNMVIKVVGPAQSGYAASQGMVNAELVSHPYDPTHKVLVHPRDFGEWAETSEGDVRTAAIGPSQDETDLQPAERDRSQQYHVGEEVKLTKGQLLRNRGGGVDTVPKGSKGRVVGDMFGDGLTLKIVFDDVSPQPMVIPASHVKHASSVTAEKVVDEIKHLRHAGYSPIDVILTARQRYGALGESALAQAKAQGLLDW